MYGKSSFPAAAVRAFASTRKLACLAIALVFSGATMWAQTVTSSLVGTVVDPADAVVSGAPVTLISVDTGAVRTATTDNLGTFRFVNLEPGTYNVTVKAPGFKAQIQTGIVVTAQETHNAGKMTMQIGSATDSITDRKSTRLN